MIGKILKATKVKPCSCPTGKICPACKKKKAVRVKPLVSVQGYKALPVPIKITTYKDKTRSTVLQPHKKKTTLKNPTVQLLQQKKTCGPCKKPAPIELANRETRICQWYKKRKALSELKQITKLERKRLKALQHEKARRDREAEFLEQLMQREKEIRRVEQELAVTPKGYSRPYYECPKTIERKPKKQKHIKATEVKLCCTPEIVCQHAKKIQKRSINERLSNFCYRICCRFFCCISFIMIIGLVVVFYY